MLILLTPEKERYGETECVDHCFEKGLPALHLRRPGWDPGLYRSLIASIHEKHHAKIVVHHHHSLAGEFRLKGIHLPGTDRGALGAGLANYVKMYREKGFSVSTSFHSIQEIASNTVAFDYAFLSPVFSSISKKGYTAKKFKAPATRFPVIALGGVDGHNISLAVKWGYKGVAVLGAIWQKDDPAAYFEKLIYSYRQAFKKPFVLKKIDHVTDHTPSPSPGLT